MCRKHPVASLSFEKQQKQSYNKFCVFKGPQCLTLHSNDSQNTERMDNTQLFCGLVLKLIF